MRDYDATTTGSPTRYYYACDANYNVTAATSSAGNAVERYYYSPYGILTFLDASFNVLATQASQIGNSVTYAGRQSDPESGLYYYRSRYLQSTMGVFLSRDPAFYTSGKWNLYEYVGSSPLDFVDPFGLWPWSKPCCNGVQYDATTSCCEGGKVVSKVSVWTCTRPLGSAPSKTGFIAKRLTFGLLHHSYICCLGANIGCTGLQTGNKAGSTVPIEGGKGGWEGDPSDCVERKVCPSYWKQKCSGDPGAPTPTCGYSYGSWGRVCWWWASH